MGHELPVSNLAWAGWVVWKVHPTGFHNLFPAFSWREIPGPRRTGRSGVKPMFAARIRVGLNPAAEKFPTSPDRFGREKAHWLVESET